MFKSFVISLFALAVMFGADNKTAKDDKWKPTPIMRTVTPDEAKVGDTVTVTGESLSKASVAEVYLTKGEDNYKLQVISQTETELVVKITPGVKEGRLRLMILTTGLEPQFLEQPLIVEIKQ